MSLSGGLDSRTVAANAKKRLGANDVICVSYGRKGCREAEISKRVAEALGYEWIFIESTAKKSGMRVIIQEKPTYSGCGLET